MDILKREHVLCGSNAKQKGNVQLRHVDKNRKRTRGISLPLRRPFGEIRRLLKYTISLASSVLEATEIRHLRLQAENIFEVLKKHG